MPVICRIIAFKREENNAPKNIGNMVILELGKNGGEWKKLSVAQSLDISVEMGDKLRIVSGTAVVMINPGTAAGSFILSPAEDKKYPGELEINEQTTKIIARGKIQVAKDIGNTSRIGGFSTR